MRHFNVTGAALLQLRDAMRRPARGKPTQAQDDASLSGAGFLDQEPDLAKEAGEHSRLNSGWAANGQPLD